MEDNIFQASIFYRFETGFNISTPQYGDFSRKHDFRFNSINGIKLKAINVHIGAPNVTDGFENCSPIWQFQMRWIMLDPTLTRKFVEDVLITNVETLPEQYRTNEQMVTITHQNNAMDITHLNLQGNGMRLMDSHFQVTNPRFFNNNFYNIFVSFSYTKNP